MPITIIKNADWVIKWDEEEKVHQYIKNADVVFQDNVITYVGKNFEGPYDEKIEKSGLFVMPGLVNIHSHTSTEVMNKGFDGDGVGGQLGEFAWVNYLFAYSPSLKDQAISAEYGMCELLLSGVTTMVDISFSYPGWFELAERSGMRFYFAPMYTSTQDEWVMDSPYEISYKWEEDEGKAKMAEALKVIDKALKHSSGRLSGMIMPAQVDTCTPDLLRDSLAAAKERGIPLQIHAGQLICEFQEIVRRHGLSPIKFLDQVGILVPETTVSHAIMLDHYRTTNFLGTNDDLSILANSGASIAHSPLIFARIGDYLDNFGSYLKEGINIGIGTDTYPHNMLEEMRTALLISKVVSGQSDNLSTADIFHAATVGGANALQRQDIGRISPGAKADLVLVNLNHPSMQPVHDPLRSLINTAAERAVRDVIINGVKVVEDGQVLTLDYLGTSKKLEQVRLRMEKSTPKNDRAGRKAEELSPLALPIDHDRSK
jgi:cytosine/adenosine deaminase-related metal-dependent hydrolase